MRSWVRQKMNQADATRDAKRARPAPAGAAASLREGLEETLAVMRLGLPQGSERMPISQTSLLSAGVFLAATPLRFAKTAPTPIIHHPRQGPAL